MLPAAAVVVFGEKPSKPFAPTVTVWTLPEEELVVEAGAEVAVVLDDGPPLSPYWPRAKGTRGSRRRGMN